MTTENTTYPSESSLAADVVNDAVGVPIAPPKRWYVAIVNRKTEHAAAERLFRGGYDAYVASQRMLTVWRNGRKAYKHRILLPCLVFVYCTERERRAIVNLPYINRFMTNPAGRTKEMMTTPLAVIPQHEIDTLKFMLAQSEIPVEIVQQKFAVRDKVKVVSGPLEGLVGEVLSLGDDESELTVALDLLGSARMSIKTSELERIKK